MDKPLRPTSRSRLVDVKCDGPSDRPIVGPQLIADARFRAEFGPRVVSTTLALAWVAAGRRAAYVSDGTFVDNVHFAAGIEVCRGAWCIVTDFAGDPVTSGRGLIVAADTEVHERLVDIIQPHLARIAARRGLRGRPADREHHRDPLLQNLGHSRGKRSQNSAIPERKEGVRLPGQRYSTATQ